MKAVKKKNATPKKVAAVWMGKDIVTAEVGRGERDWQEEMRTAITDLHGSLCKMTKQAQDDVLSGSLAPDLKCARVRIQVFGHVLGLIAVENLPNDQPEWMPLVPAAPQQTMLS